MPEPETVKLAADGVVWKIASSVTSYVAAGVVAVFGFLFKRVIDKHDGEIKSLKEGIAANQDAIGLKADKDEQTRIRDSIGTLFKQQREDKDEILRAIVKLGEGVTTFKETVLTELGNRPTRAEMSMNQGPRRRGYDRSGE